MLLLKFFVISAVYQLPSKKQYPSRGGTFIDPDKRRHVPLWERPFT